MYGLELVTKDEKEKCIDDGKRCFYNVLYLNCQFEMFFYRIFHEVPLKKI